jgi:hypothetical protein
MTAAVIQFPGKCHVKVNISESKSGLVVDLLSKKYLVHVTNELLDKIEEIEGVKVHIESKKVDLPKDTRRDFKKFAKV